MSGCLGWEPDWPCAPRGSLGAATQRSRLARSPGQAGREGQWEQRDCGESKQAAEKPVSDTHLNIGFFAKEQGRNKHDLD